MQEDSEAQDLLLRLVKGQRWLKACREIAANGGSVDANIFATILHSREAGTPLWFLKLLFRLLPDDIRREEYRIGKKIVSKEHGEAIYAFFKTMKPYDDIVSDMQDDMWR